MYKLGYITRCDLEVEIANILQSIDSSYLYFCGERIDYCDKELMEEELLALDIEVEFNYNNKQLIRN